MIDSPDYNGESAEETLRREIERLMPNQQATQQRARESKLISVPAFILDSDDVLSGAGLDAATPAGARVFGGDDKAGVVGDVVQDGVKSWLGTVSHSPFAAEMVGLLQQICVHPDPVQVSLLKIPSAGVEAFWVKKCGKEFIIPIAPIDEELQAKPAFPPDEFLAILRGLAKAYRQFDATA